MCGIYRDKNLKHYGLTSFQILCIIRKFQFIVEKTDEEYRDNFRNATNIEDVTRVLDNTILSIKKRISKKGTQRYVFLHF